MDHDISIYSIKKCSHSCQTLTSSLHGPYRLCPRTTVLIMAFPFSPSHTTLFSNCLKSQEAHCSFSCGLHFNMLWDFEWRPLTLTVVGHYNGPIYRSNSLAVLATILVARIYAWHTKVHSLALRTIIITSFMHESCSLRAFAWDIDDASYTIDTPIPDCQLTVLHINVYCLYSVCYVIIGDEVTLPAC